MTTRSFSAQIESLTPTTLNVTLNNVSFIKAAEAKVHPKTIHLGWMMLFPHVRRWQARGLWLPQQAA